MQVIVLGTQGRHLVEKTKAMGCYGITSRKEKADGGPKKAWAAKMQN